MQEKMRGREFFCLAFRSKGYLHCETKKMFGLTKGLDKTYLVMYSGLVLSIGHHFGERL